MVLEIAMLQVKPGQTAEFEAAFATAQLIISSMPGYVSHELQRCLEDAHHYSLLVRWETLANAGRPHFWIPAVAAMPGMA